jgi:hypothetical protein
VQNKDWQEINTLYIYIESLKYPKTMPRLSPELLDQALRLTAERLAQLNAPQESLVVFPALVKEAITQLGFPHVATQL